MPAVRTGERSLADMPRYISAIQDAEDQGWMVRGYCRHDDGATNVAWSVTPAQRVEVGGAKYLGAELIAYAAAVCELCPVQWACARFAITTEVPGGTWGLAYEDLAWLKTDRTKEAALAFIDEADAEDVPVQVAVIRARA